MLELNVISPVLLWTAIAIYAAAFVAYAFDLARRSQATADAQNVRESVLVGAGGASIPAASGGSDAGSAPQRFVMARIGTSLTVLGFLFHLASAVTRGIAAGRVPWANLYEFAMMGTLLIIAVYLVVLTRIDLRFLGTFITGLVVVLLGLGATNFYVDVSPLMDPLKSVWLVIHVFVASLATAFFALAFALSVIQLMQSRRERLLGEGATKTGPGFLRTFPNAVRLESLAYMFTIIGFILWTFTLIAGSIWAYYAWSRFWGFDVKETWTFVIWVIYAGYIHARATRGWRGNPSAWLAIVGFSAVIFNFTIVNVFFKGLHAYSGLS
ncbi:c-type cytochrome biogenesis protein CcsB [Microbacterium oxydans]|jgi:cytochrome c-type biogenesis protein CcsB|uniref:c-type cytochrome biogenesis protein CcsB n=1 Tax=Microbacterium TaxID=33882 RepID=UPI000734FC7C|nr:MULTISPECIES: c-type cytochrome biogenesis protein CcsB [Microbacterium]KAB1889572.1 c-type cytochrome biogenesis protein CcsB [Microbacterium oxydans]KTR79302.1 ABC transporter [Microbacterium oxydans]MBE7955489.1 c-type cytochrome biogenesis protein CcsB [Microbacterium sp. R1]MCB8043547.1 c-type cytochrome biogenesis protein CcsB [Microbacterium oxydans]NYF29120.1 cytochrome c-type biogenesis protein CcsB [Microbacterium sp. JAI119]